MSDNIVFLTRDTARKAREERDAGYVFPLKMSGSFARVRVPNLNDRVFLNNLPVAAQRVISDALLEAENQRRNDDGSRKEDTGPRTQKEAWLKFVELAGEQEDAANELVMACFLEPRVVKDERHLDPRDPSMVTVADIHLEDKLDFLAICLAGEGAANRKLKLFRGSVDDAPGQPGHETAPSTLGVSGTPFLRTMDGG